MIRTLSCLYDMDEVRKVFNRYDANGDGKISPSELRKMVRALGGSGASDREVAVMIEEMDSNRDGFVDLEEFEAFHSRDNGRKDEELKDAFDAYDVDRNGLISAKELHMVMKQLGERCSIKDCQKMIRSVDSDGDGCVNLEEFKKMMGGCGH